MLSTTNRVAPYAPATGFSLILTVALGASLGLGWAGARADDKALTDLLKPFQGSWATTGDGPDATWTFEGATAKASVAGAEYSCKVKVDKNAKPFSTLDLEITDGPDEAKGKVSKGIYKFDRPTEFSTVDDEAYLFELKKEKKKD
jgi:uncharacterized protein (TIGR03067 family)